MFRVVARPVNCSLHHVDQWVDQVASPWDRAVARARFGPPEPEGGDNIMEAEARFVVARSRSTEETMRAADSDDTPDYNPAPCDVPVPRRVLRSTVQVIGGDDHDDDDDSSRPADLHDSMYGRSVGGVVGARSMSEWAYCPRGNVEESVCGPGDEQPGRYIGRECRERTMRSEKRVLYHGKHGPVSSDNVHGCVRDLIVPLGRMGRNGHLETHDLPRSGEIVVLCQDPRCVLTHTHPCDNGGECSLWSSVPFTVPDVVKRGVPHVSSMCSRTCHSCGLTHSSRTSLMLCMGCHAMTPYLKSGGSDNGDEVIEDRYRFTPVYCDEKCQERHWGAHGTLCRRDDVSVHVRACGAFTMNTRRYGRSVVIRGVRSRIPWLQRSSLDQPGAYAGWGTT